ncbi:MAG: sigma-70 family RNA polymerase sigma factor [Ktedonobacterales bacterium]|nr:sigma-70 family RNA polymerase sigma factor [Ktedonobacterales bacterium]
MDETVRGSPDRAAFRTLYDAYLGAIYRYIFRRVGNREEAEDLTATVFTKAVRGMDWAQPEVARVAWLFQVARTTLADHWRVRGSAQFVSLDILLADGWEAAHHPQRDQGDTLQESVEALLRALPDNYRQVLHCRFLLNYTIKETAAELGLSEANVKVLQLRALRRAATLRQPSPAQKGAAHDA